VSDTATAQAVDQVPGEPTVKSAVIGEILGCTVLGFLGLSAGLAGFFNRQGVVWTSDIWPTVFAWAFSIALAIYIAAPLSGAHFNPAVTIALAVSRRFPWRRVPLYIACDLLGWLLGAALAVLMQGESMRRAAEAAGVQYGAKGSETIASALTTYVPAPGFGTGGPAYSEFPIWRGFVGEILGTMMLVLVVLALSESRHASAPAGWFFPLIVGTTVGMVILIEAPLSQASLNPTRDLGPRIMLLFLGFGTVAFPGPRNGLALLVTTIGPIIGGLLGMLIHDRLIRDTLTQLMHAPMPRIHNPGDLAREPVVISQLPAGEPWEEVGAAAGNGRRAPGHQEIDMVTFDMGGSLYDDDGWAQALKQAVSELAGDRFDEQAFWEEYDAQRERQGDLRTAMATRFGVDREQLHELAGRYLRYGRDHLYPEVTSTLRSLAGRYRLGVVANQDEAVLEALRRDGLLELFDVVALAKAAGAMKPDPRIWQYALRQAGVAPDRAVHVGNRLDADVRPAKQLGMRTIWLVRGEAPSSPTVEQLAEADAVVTSLADVPRMVAGMDARVAAAPTGS
jgi:MIP family channel proteins/HAD superfamily hydrolase (TIGR01509 family)